jgi:hypothetical protein
MPKMPKSVQWRTEPDFSTPPVVPWSAGFAAGDSSPGAAVDWRKLPERTPIKPRRSQSQSVAVIKSSNDGIIRPRSISRHKNSPKNACEVVHDEAVSPPVSSMQ